MANIKSVLNKKLEIIGLVLVLVLVLFFVFMRNDSIPAAISAVCGITYTFFAGKGLPVCYLFGITGSVFYGIISFQNCLWGNLILYLGYYVPMQILGYFRWNKNLKTGKKEIVKIRIPKKELGVLLLVLCLLNVIILELLIHFKDSNPLLDSITTTASLGGMYLTVRRAIEQWIFWFIVNLLSLLMWINVAINGEYVCSTILMWSVYLFLSIYFYIKWNKELKLNP